MRVPSEVVFEVDEAPEGGYTAYAVGFAIFTQADTSEELRAMVRDAVQVHFDEAERPGVIRLRLIRHERVAREELLALL